MPSPAPRQPTAPGSQVKALADELGMGSDSDDGGSAGNFVMPGKGPKMQGGEEYVDVEVDPETGFKEAGFDLKVRAA